MDWFGLVWIELDCDCGVIVGVIVIVIVVVVANMLLPDAAVASCSSWCRSFVVCSSFFIRQVGIHRLLSIYTHKLILVHYVCETVLEILIH